MTIRNKQDFMDGVWDWSPLNGCFDPSSIQPSDIDGFVESRGFFLYLEGKPEGWTFDAKTGQTKGLMHRTRDGLSTVLFVWGRRQDKTASIRRTSIRPYTPTGYMLFPPLCDTRKVTRKGVQEVEGWEGIRSLCEGWTEENSKSSWKMALLGAAKRYLNLVIDHVGIRTKPG